MAPKPLGRAADRIARATGMSARENRRVIRAAYAALLGREAADGEVAHWASRMATGMTWGRFLTLMRNSEEFQKGPAQALAALDGEVHLSLVGGRQVGGRVLRYAAPADDPVILPSLIQNAGEWEPHVTRAFQAIVRPGDTVVDAGANSGYFTVLAAALVGDQGRVVALEPSDVARYWCERNVALNNLTNVQVMPTGLWSEATTLQIRVVQRASTAGHLATDPTAPLSAGEVAVDVPCTSLDDLAQQGALDPERIGLVKMVIQGSEPWALRGMAGCLALHRPPITCEVNPTCLAALGSSPAQMGVTLRDLGYRITILPQDHQHEWFAHLAPVAEHPDLRLRAVADLGALVASLPTLDDPIDLLALPA